MAGDASCFWRLDLGELSPEEPFQVQVEEKSTMVGEDDLVEWVDAALVYEGYDPRGDEDVVQALGAAAVGAGFAVSAMWVGMWIDKVALNDEVC